MASNYLLLSDLFYFEITMYNASLVQVLERLQDLLDQVAGILLCVAPLLHDAVEQLPTGHPENGHPITAQLTQTQ